MSKNVLTHIGFNLWCTPFALCYGLGAYKLFRSMGEGQIGIYRRQPNRKHYGEHISGSHLKWATQLN